MTQNITRRRMISIIASTAGCTLAAPSALAGKNLQPIVWRGVALGAQTQIKLYHEDASTAAGVLAKCQTEISRLENLFSLYRKNSQINQLNRNGFIASPDFDMLDLCSKSALVSQQTNGAFDITVQPLWDLYRNHFPAVNGPNETQIAETLKLVNYRAVELSSHNITLKKQGMAVTFNGIAQGYITDKIAKLLKSNGWSDVLIDLGETYGMGTKPGNNTWKIAIADPGNSSGTIKTITLKNQAIATSGGYGTPFSNDGKHHHLFDPATGSSTNRYKSVSVIAPRAVLADALSTAFSAMEAPDIKSVLQRFAKTYAIIVKNDGTIEKI